MEAMDTGDSFACPDDFRAQGIAAQMHIHTERRFRTKNTHEFKGGKWITDRRVWRVS
jgi:hypothetical protein